MPLQPSMGMSERAAAASPSAVRPFEFTGCAANGGITTQILRSALLVA